MGISCEIPRAGYTKRNLQQLSVLQAVDYRLSQTTGLRDNQNLPTGFPTVLPPSAPSAVGYFPDNLLVEESWLNITTTSGTFYRGSNNQANALSFQIPLVDPTSPYEVEATLVNINKLAFGEFQSAGIFWGPNDGKKAEI